MCVCVRGKIGRFNVSQIVRCYEKDCNEREGEINGINRFVHGNCHRIRVGVQYCGPNEITQKRNWN